mmetsp:Transcript_43408/g.81345  ORF Transcript_43408/g.81345 Transcript_43408/m.81345 type:complete len:105 (-) Transcript_43408:258-572(-)
MSLFMCVEAHAHLNQCLYHLHKYVTTSLSVPLPSSYMKRCASILVKRVHIRPQLHQRLYNLYVPIFNSHMQCSASVLVQCTHILSQLHQLANFFHLAFLCCVMK